MDKYTYQIGKNLYINLTNKCDMDCVFCVRRSGSIDGHELWLKKEPTANEVISQISDPTRYDEIVFCGFGEPTYALDVMKKVAAYVKSRGGKTRLNTNGHGNLINGRNIVGELEDIDTASISLNASNEAKYHADCRSTFGSASYNAMLDFARDCKKNLPHTVLSVVDVIGEAEIAACRKVASSIGVELRVRNVI